MALISQVMAAATPVEGAPAAQLGASPAPSSAVKPGGVPRVSGSSIEEAENLLLKLREFVESKGETCRGTPGLQPC
jgi:hypothetical protein